MEVTVRHVRTGHSCVVGVPDGGTVLSLKADAVKAMFERSTNADDEAAAVVARIEGCDEDLDDADCVADTGLESGDGVQMVPRWPHVKGPSVYNNGHGSEIECITLSRCGTRCAVGYAGGRITVFDTRTADFVADLTQEEVAAGGSPQATVILNTAFSVCGTWLATCSNDSTICVWLTATWEQRWCLEAHDADVWSAAWTHCGRLVSGDSHGNVYVWDLEGAPSATALGRMCVVEGFGETINGIAVSATRIFTASDDTFIQVYDVSTLAHTRTLSGDGGGVRHIALTNSEDHLVSCSSYHFLGVWSTATLSIVRSVYVSAAPYLLALSQAGDVLAVSFGKHTKLLKCSTLRCVGQVASESLAVALSPCGRWVFTSGGSSVAVGAVCDVPSESVL